LASCKAPKGHWQASRGKNIHNFFAAYTQHLDTAQPLKQALKAAFFRRLMNEKSPCFIDFFEQIAVFVRARTVWPISRAFTDC